MPALLSPSMPTLLSPPVLALLSTIVPTLLSPLLPALLFPLLPALLSFSMPALSSLPILALISCLVLGLLSFSMPGSSSCFVLGLTPTYLVSSALKTFKPVLSDEPLYRHLTSLTDPFCLFSTPGLLPMNNKRKRLFDKAFINSRLFVGNHTAKEFDLSFEECGCPALVKFNRL